jgi:hypothetical protein
VALVGSWAQWVMLHDMDKVADKVFLCIDRERERERERERDSERG